MGGVLRYFSKYRGSGVDSTLLIRARIEIFKPALKFSIGIELFGPSGMARFLDAGRPIVKERHGGVEKRGGWKTSRMTPLPKRGFGPPPRTVRFPPPSGVNVLFFLYKNPRQSRPEALLEGSKHFRERAFSGTFSSPHTFCTPPLSRPNIVVLICRFSGLWAYKCPCCDRACPDLLRKQEAKSWLARSTITPQARKCPPGRAQ